jgi:predicted  nucleic acid-binding Zn-ribbon protein
MEALVEDYRCQAEVSEEETVTLRTQIVDLNREKEDLMTERDGVSAQFEKQQERLESARVQFNGMETSLLSCQEELFFETCTKKYGVRTLSI